MLNQTKTTSSWHKAILWTLSHTIYENKSTSSLADAKLSCKYFKMSSWLKLSDSMPGDLVSLSETLPWLERIVFGLTGMAGLPCAPDCAESLGVVPVPAAFGLAGRVGFLGSEGFVGVCGFVKCDSCCKSSSPFCGLFFLFLTSTVRSWSRLSSILWMTWI